MRTVMEIVDGGWTWFALLGLLCMHGRLGWGGVRVEAVDGQIDGWIDRWIDQGGLHAFLAYCSYSLKCLRYHLKIIAELASCLLNK